MAALSPPSSPCKGSDNQAAHVVFFVFRWGGKDPVKGEDTFSYTDNNIDELLQTHVRHRLRAFYGSDGVSIREYRIQDADDFRRAVNEAQTEARGVRHAGAFYFLWPSLQGSGKDPAMPPGCIDSQALYLGMALLESGGVSSIFPGPVKLYEALSGKTWVHSLAQPESADFFGMPPTCLIRRADIDPGALPGRFERATKTALAQLDDRWQSQQARSRHDLPRQVVMKLGCSWESMDVCFCERSALSASLMLAGMMRRGRHDGCIVQDAIPDVACEMRYHVVFGEICDVRATRYRRQCKACCSPSGFQKLSQDAEMVARLCFGGDLRLLRATDARCRQLIQRLLDWILHQLLGDDASRIPVYLRFDFLISRPTCRRYPKIAAESTVWTGEIGEFGSSLCGWEAGRGEVFEAALQRFFQACAEQCSSWDCVCHNACFTYGDVSFDREANSTWMLAGGLDSSLCWDGLGYLLSSTGLLNTCIGCNCMKDRHAIKRRDELIVCESCGLHVGKAPACKACGLGFCLTCLLSGEALQKCSCAVCYARKGVLSVRCTECFKHCESWQSKAEQPELGA